MKSKETTSFVEKSLDIELKLFELTLAITLLILLFWTVVSNIIGYNYPVRIIYAASFAIYLGIYVVYKKGFSFNVVTSLYYSAAYLILAIAWLPSGGIGGSIIHFFVLIFISGLLVLQAKAYLVLISASATLVLSYGLYEFLNPQVAVQYATDMERIRDITITGL